MMKSMARVERSITLRPQPLGIFAGAAALLLLPETNTPIQADALDELLSGNADVEIPPQWRFFQKAIYGDIESAREMLEPVDTDSDDLSKYNSFVLAPSQDLYASLRLSSSGELRPMLDIAAFNAGLIASLPESLELDGELLAWALASAAAADIEKEDYSSARERLAKAIELAQANSPLLAAILIAQSAQIGHSCLDMPLGMVQKEYESSIAIAKQHKLPGFVAELWTQMGMVLQQAATVHKSALPAAIRAYQAALQTPVQAETEPQLFAELHNNLGLAYLALPDSGASNQLRTGIAIQSFRSALSAIRPDSISPDHTSSPDDTSTSRSSSNDAELWARINMNLANALQYAPSSHPEGNLIQAVEIYDDVLTVRTRARDPVAYALVLLNQANALAHLGIFKPSLEKASEAYKLFQWYNQPEQSVTARELVEQVNDALTRNASNLATDTQLLETPSSEVPSPEVPSPEKVLHP